MPRRFDSDRRVSSLIPWIGALLLGYVFFFFRLAALPLFGPDEPRYAAVAAAMLQRHDFLTPWLWGAPWLEKPVLYYWLAAISGIIGHFTGWAPETIARLPNAMLAVGLCLALACFLRRVHSLRAATLALCIAPSSVFIFAFARSATTDMPLTCFLSVALMLCYLAWSEQRPVWLYLSAGSLALATLAKGPVALVLAIPICGIFLLWNSNPGNRLGDFRRLLHPLPVVLYLAITLPWYIAVSLRNPSFPRVFLLEHNIERFTGSMTPAYLHPRPFWFYIPVLLAALFPWSAWLALPLGACRSPQLHSLPLRRFLASWSIVVFAFFSIQSSKLPAYVLPAVPALIALIAVYVDENWERLPRWPMAASALLVGAMPLVLRALPYVFAPRHLRPLPSYVLQNSALCALAVLFAIALLALAWRRRTVPLVVATVLATAAVILTANLPPVASQTNRLSGMRLLARHLEAGGAEVYGWQLSRDEQYGLNFYLGSLVPPLFPEASPLPGSRIVATSMALDSLRRQATLRGWSLKELAPVGAYGPCAIFQLTN